MQQRLVQWLADMTMRPGCSQGNTQGWKAEVVLAFTHGRHANSTYACNTKSPPHAARSAPRSHAPDPLAGQLGANYTGCQSMAMRSQHDDINQEIFSNDTRLPWLHGTIHYDMHPAHDCH
jgi:hypothetical protein